MRTVTYVTSREVAERFGVARRTVITWHNTGKLKAAYIVPGYRGVFLYDPKAVDRFAESRGVK